MKLYLRPLSAIAIGIFVGCMIEGCSMPSLRVTLESGEATTGETTIQHRGTSYAESTTGGNFISAFSATPVPTAVPVVP